MALRHRERRNDARPEPGRLQPRLQRRSGGALLGPLLPVPPAVALTAGRVGIEPGRDEEVVVGGRGHSRLRLRRGLHDGRWGGEQPRGLDRLADAALAARLLAAATPLLLALVRPLADRRGAHSRTDRAADDGGDRGPREILDPEQLAEDDAHGQSDGPAEKERTPKRLLVALGRQAAAAVPSALQDLLAALGGGGHRHGNSLTPRGREISPTRPSEPADLAAASSAPRSPPAATRGTAAG